MKRKYIIAILIVTMLSVLYIFITLLDGEGKIEKQSMFFWLTLSCLASYTIPLIGLLLVPFFDFLFRGDTNIMGINPKVIIVSVLLIRYLIEICTSRNTNEQNSRGVNVVRLFLPVALFIIWMLTIYEIRGVKLDLALVRTFGSFVSTVIFSFLLVYFIKTETEVGIVLKTVVFVLLISCSIAIFQFFDANLGYKIVSMLKKTDFEFLRLNAALKRPKGLSLTSIIFSYELVIFCSVAFIFAFLKKKHQPSLFWISAFFILFCVLLLNFTRSAIGALILIIVVFLTINKESKVRISRKRKWVFLILVSIVIVLYIFSYGKEYNQRLRFADSSYRGRHTLFFVSVWMSLRNPLGSGSFENYAQTIDNSDLYLSRHRYKLVTTVAPHNHFFLILSFFGFPGFILLLWYFKNILKNASRGKNSRFLLMRYSLPIFLGYILHCFFHNAGPFAGDVAIWYFFAFQIIYLKLS